MWKVEGSGREESARVGEEKEAEKGERPGEGGHLFLSTSFFRSWSLAVVTVSAGG